MEEFAGAAGAEGDEEAWKNFKSDTKAGRLLGKLYGTQKKVEITYPGLRVVESSTEKRPAFIPGGGKHDVDARTNRIKKVEVYSDYEGKPTQMPAPIEYLRRRKNKDRIDAELKARSIQLETNKMAYDSSVPSREVQKSQLQMNFQFKGGKALPDAGMMPAMESTLNVSKLKAGPVLTEEETLFQQIVKEIDDRQKFLQDMAALGDHTHDVRVTKEIEERIKDMDMLNKLIESQKSKRRSR